MTPKCLPWNIFAVPATINGRKFAARAQRLTGAPLNLHPGRKREATFELVDILRDAGADLTRTVMSHVDVRIRTHEERAKLAKTGCYLEYDNFGFEGPWPLTLNWDPEIDIPTDEKRITEISQLIEGGFLNQILVSLDTCMKFHLIKYGGHGYNHLARYVVPMMLRQGMTTATDRYHHD